MPFSGIERAAPAADPNFRVGPEPLVRSGGGAKDNTVNKLPQSPMMLPRSDALATLPTASSPHGPGVVPECGVSLLSSPIQEVVR